MITLLAIALFTLATAAVAMALRNLIHTALLLVASWAGIAAFYLWAGAEFIAFAQVLIYVGAVSMVVLFAVLLTRQSRIEPPTTAPNFRRAIAAILAGLAVFVVLASTVLRTPFTDFRDGSAPTITVRDVGIQLMESHGAAVLVVGVILTVSLLGAVVLAASHSHPKGPAP
jgi:NADH:ubiquinone oxidoreductase subunit 6 (subunit J)